MQIQSITYNYKTKLLNPVFKQNNVAEENQSPIVPDYRQESFITEISRNYAVSSPNFSPAQIKSSQIRLMLTDKKIDPHFSIEISNSKPQPHKPGVFSIYKMALHDQIFEELQNNPELKEKGSYITPNSRKINIDCPQKDLIKTLKTVNEKFVKLQIDEKYFNEAKQLAPAAYFLYLKTNYEPEDYQDLPNNMSVEEYEKLINNLIYDDMIHYNEELLNNSNIRIELKINKDFYNQNEKEILGYLDNIKGLKNEN